MLAEDKLFATLDPSSRRLRFPEERELIITDTVGFIRQLPKELMEAFQATLEELEEADLLLHVVDASHPELDMHINAVERILENLGLQEIPRILVLNKCDLLAPGEDPLAGLESGHGRLVYVSAQTGEGLDRLAEAIIDQVDWKRDFSNIRGDNRFEEEIFQE